MRASKIVGLLIGTGALLGATIATVQAATITTVGAASFPAPVDRDYRTGGRYAFA